MYFINGLLLVWILVHSSWGCSTNSMNIFRETVTRRNLGYAERPNYHDSVTPENLKISAGDIISCDISQAAEHFFLASSPTTVIHASGTSDGDVTGSTEIIEETFKVAAFGRYKNCVVLNEFYDRKTLSSCMYDYKPPGMRSIDDATEEARKSVVKFYHRKTHYDFMKCNCEHWVTAWRYGIAVSMQFQRSKLGMVSDVAEAKCEAPVLKGLERKCKYPWDPYPT